MAEGGSRLIVLQGQEIKLFVQFGHRIKLSQTVTCAKKSRQQAHTILDVPAKTEKRS